MAGPEWPSVSVVIPVRNEVRTIQPAIEAVLAQDYPGSLEVVVADGMSADGTRDVLGSLMKEDNRVRMVDNHARSTPAALNAAIRVSSGDLVVRCDAHSRFPPGYIRRAVELLRETGADNVGGIQAAAGEGLMQRAIALGMSIPMGVGDARFHYGGEPGPADTVFLGVFRREALDRVGLFDERLLRNQDAELNHRLRASGGLVYFHPDLRVEYRPRGSLRALWRQYFGSGAWKRTTFRISPGSFRARQAAPPLLVIGLVASIGLAFSPMPWLGLIVPGAYGAALVSSATWYAARGRGAAAALLPVVLPTMHLAWGSGFLLGWTRPRGAR